MAKKLVFMFSLLSSCSQAPAPRDHAKKSQTIPATSEKSQTSDSTDAGVGTSNSDDKSGGTTQESTDSTSLPDTAPPSSGSSNPTTELPISTTTGIAKLPIVASPGCNKAATQELAKYVRKNVTGMNRNYQLYIPANYDKAKPYRLFVMGHGCNGNNAPFKMESVAGDQAILVALKSVDSCFVYNMQGEGAYFDQVVKEVTNDTCVDTNRVFLSGFSSGAWLANMFGCTRANQIRAQGNVAGGLAGGLPACQGPIAALMIHDDKDMDVKIAEGIKARDRVLKINSCSSETEAYAYNDDPKAASLCVRYKGCKPGYPVVWCQTSGKAHSSSEPFSTQAFWKFWSGF